MQKFAIYDPARGPFKGVMALMAPNPRLAALRAATIWDTRTIAVIPAVKASTATFDSLVRLVHRRHASRHIYAVIDGIPREVTP